MANCIKCGALMDDNDSVCPVCGNTQVGVDSTLEQVQPVESKASGSEAVVQNPFVDQVAQPSAETQVPVVETTVQPPVVPTEQPEKKKIDTKTLIMGIVIGILVVAIIVLIVLLANKKEVVKEVPVPSKDKEKVEVVNDSSIQLGDYSFVIPENWNTLDNSDNLYVLFHKMDDIEDITIMFKVFDINLSSVSYISSSIKGMGYNISKEEDIKLKNFDDKAKHLVTSNNGKIYDIYYVPTFTDDTIMINMIYLNEESKNKYSNEVQKFLDSLKYISDSEVINDYDDYYDNYLNFKSALNN